MYPNHTYKPIFTLCEAVWNDFGGEGKDWRITKINNTKGHKKINLTSRGIRTLLRYPQPGPTTMYIFISDRSE